MDAQQRQDLIERYSKGYDEVAAALDGGAQDDLDRRDPGAWSAREIIHHLADSEMTSAIRLRRLLAEDSPQIVGYDEEEYARRLHYDRPVRNSLDAFRAARAATVEILERLSDQDWSRAGTHSESGSYSMEDWLRIYAAHAHDHAEQIRIALQG